MRRNTTILAGSLVLLAAAAGLVAYWFWAAGQVSGAIARWAEEQRARGYEVAYGGPAIGGFPLALSARLESPALASPHGWRWTGDSVLAAADLWAPLTLRLELPRVQELSGQLNGSARRLAIAAGQARGLARLRGDGELEAASLEFTELSLTADTGWAALVERLRYDVTAQAAARVHVNGEATGVRLPEAGVLPFGDAVERLALEATVIGAAGPGAPAAALAAWRDRGGLVEVGALELRWGPLEIAASGTGGLDRALRPEGTFEARIRGLPEAVETLSARGLIEAGAATALKLVAFAMARGEPGGGRPTVALPITLRDGLAYLGPVPLFPIGPVL